MNVTTEEYRELKDQQNKVKYLIEKVEAEKQAEKQAEQNEKDNMTVYEIWKLKEDTIAKLIKCDARVSDGELCEYCKRIITERDLNLDHKIPDMCGTCKRKDPVYKELCDKIDECEDQLTNKYEIDEENDWDYYEMIENDTKIWKWESKHHVPGSYKIEDMIKDHQMMNKLRNGNSGTIAWVDKDKVEHKFTATLKDMKDAVNYKAKFDKISNEINLKDKLSCAHNAIERESCGRIEELKKEFRKEFSGTYMKHTTADQMFRGY